MAGSTDPTLSIHQLPKKCSYCGYFCHPHASICPECGHSLEMPPVVDTKILETPPETLPVERQGQTILDRHTHAILEFLPSGLCMSAWLEEPIILGRGPSIDSIDVIDLTELNGIRHGVSRRDCQHQRRGTQMILTDIGSRNGTYLNGKLIAPFHEYVLSHGDRVILGTLHLNIFFSVPGIDA
jgi:hypothetical protein